jgi:hypothetical protein
MARAASAVEEGLAAAHMETNAFNGSKVAEVDEGGHGGAANVRHAARRRAGGIRMRRLKRAARAADEQSMRRLLAIAVLAAVTVTATAFAATPLDGAFRAQKGKVQKDSELAFKVTGAGSRVTRLRARLLETCQGQDSSALTAVTSDATWTVRKGEFNARKKEVRASTTYYTTFEGEFTSRSRATGSIRQVAYRAGKRCDTYKVPFTAKRG